MANINNQVKKISSELLKTCVNSSDYYKFGAEYFGPFLYGFTHWLYSSVNQKKYSKIFFLSRDGYIMKQAFDIFNTNHIECEYVYFSLIVKVVVSKNLYSCFDRLSDIVLYLT